MYIIQLTTKNIYFSLKNIYIVIPAVQLLANILHILFV